MQRIFYFHVASAWVGFAAFGVTFGASIAYLARQATRYDRLARSSGEVGLAFMAMAVVSGALWARPVWGVYWTWEPRLTISAVQLGVYLAYVMLRGLVEDPERGARFAAVYGIAAFSTVPLSWFAIRWWRTIHPDIVTGGGGMAMTPPMLYTLLAAIGAFSILYVTHYARAHTPGGSRRAPGPPAPEAGPKKREMVHGGNVVYLAGPTVCSGPAPWAWSSPCGAGSDQIAPERDRLGASAPYRSADEPSGRPSG